MFSTLAMIAGSWSAPPRAEAVGCVPQPPEHDATSRGVCIADQPFRARGYLNARCHEVRPVPGQRYPAPGWCGGGRYNIEYIAHARFNAQLGYDPRGVAPEVQWEIRTGSGRDRADTTHDAGRGDGRIDLYEVKRTTNADYLKTIGQLGTYATAFAARNVTIRLGDEDYFDYFLVGRPEPCDAGGGRMVQANRRFFSWSIAPGVIAVWEAPFACFDAERERIPVPVLEPAERRVPVPVDQKENEEPRDADVPVGRMGEGVMAQPVPGTTLLTGANPLAPHISSPRRRPAALRRAAVRPARPAAILI